MDRGLFVDQSAGRETTLRDLINIYLKAVTANRPSEDSRGAEAARLKRFLREEPALCTYAAVNLRPEHFEGYRCEFSSDKRGNICASRAWGFLLGHMSGMVLAWS